MSDNFYKRLDDATRIGPGVRRLLEERPENLHDYQGCAKDAVESNEVEQPKAGELPPLELTHEDDLKAIRNAGYEMGGNLAAELSCRERQLLAEQQVSAGLREENATLTKKGQELCATLGNLGIHIHKLGLRNDGEMGEWKYRNARAEAAEASLAEANAELATLKAQEAPEKAWERAYLAGALHVSGDLGASLGGIYIDPYTPPKESEWPR